MRWQIFWTSEPNCESEPTKVKLDPTFVAPKFCVFALYNIPVMQSDKNLHRRFPLLDDLSLISPVTLEEAPVCNWLHSITLHMGLKCLRLLTLRTCFEGDDEDEDGVCEEGDKGENGDKDGNSNLESSLCFPSLGELVIQREPFGHPYGALAV